MRSDLGGTLREFTIRESHYFQTLRLNDEGRINIFSSQERQWLVLQILQTLRASQDDMKALQGRASVEQGQSIVTAWQSTGLIIQIFPLHHTNELTRLQSNWVTKVFAPQPLGKISSNFT